MMPSNSSCTALGRISSIGSTAMRTIFPSPDATLAIGSSRRLAAGGRQIGDLVDDLLAEHVVELIDRAEHRLA